MSTNNFPSDPTPAQEEFHSLVANGKFHRSSHPEDSLSRSRSSSSSSPARNSDLSEEDAYRAAQIDAAMRMPALDRSNGTELRLPPASFDSGRATGVKGVIADARSYENARRAKFMDKVRTVRRSVFGSDGDGNDGNSMSRHAASGSRSSSEASDELLGSLDGDDGGRPDRDEAAFLEQWRENRRRELETATSKPAARGHRRTSPSVRMYGRMDEVDALGYLDAIEKVRRETVVVVFVYDPGCVVSATVEAAMLPLVSENPEVHFVKVHCDDIEFDDAAVPAVLAYRNQGDLFANLTGIVEMIPEDDDFGTDSLERILRQHRVL